jgi:hypothetical protein
MAYDKQQFFKRNYVDAMEPLLPKIYKTRDDEVVTKESSVDSELINSHLNIIQDFVKLVGPTSAINNTIAEDINDPETLSKFFIKQNFLNKITPHTFEYKILKPLGLSYLDFDTSADFKYYLEETLLPALSVSSMGFPGAFYETHTHPRRKLLYRYGSTCSAVHIYLLESLGLFYMLNRPYPPPLNHMQDQRYWGTNINFLQDEEYGPGEGPPKFGIPGTLEYNNPMRFNWDNDSSTISKYTSGVVDPFGGNNATRLRLQTPPPDIWPTIPDRTGATQRFRLKNAGFGTSGNIYWSFWVRAKKFTGSMSFTNPQKGGKLIRTTHMGHGHAGPNRVYHPTSKWQQCILRAAEQFTQSEYELTHNKRFIKYYIKPKWSAVGHGHPDVGWWAGPPWAEYWQDGDEIEYAYPAVYIDTCEDGLGWRAFDTLGQGKQILAPDISQKDYLKCSPSGGYNAAQGNAGVVPTVIWGGNNTPPAWKDIDFLTWDDTQYEWLDPVETSEGYYTLLDAVKAFWVGSHFKYRFSLAEYSLPATGGNGQAAIGTGGIVTGDPEKLLGGTAAQVCKDWNVTDMELGGITHHIALESKKNYKWTVYIAKMGDRVENEGFEEETSDIVSLLEFAYSADYPTSPAKIIDCAEAPCFDPDGNVIIPDNFSYHRLWLNWNASANEVSSVYSDSVNTPDSSYEVESIGMTGWYKVSLNLTIDPSGTHDENAVNGIGELVGNPYGILTYYPNRHYKPGRDFSRSPQDPITTPTVKSGLIALGRTYITDPDYIIPDDFSVSGEVYTFSVAKRNVSYDAQVGPYFSRFGADPSAGVVSNLLKLYRGETIDTNDAVNAYQEYIWGNYYGSPSMYKQDPTTHNPQAVDPFFGYNRGLSSLNEDYLPGKLLRQDTTYASGTQNLFKLYTLNDINYSPLYADRNDLRMKQAISNYFLLGRYVTDKKQLGPLFKLLQAIGYVTFDINDQVERLQQLLSIKDCPDNLLPYLADIIGWKLYGYNVSSWRRQLWNAVDLYNAKGSVYGLQKALEVILPNNPLLINGEFYVQKKAENLLGDGT